MSAEKYGGVWCFQCDRESMLRTYGVNYCSFVVYSRMKSIERYCLPTKQKGDIR